MGKTLEKHTEIERSIIKKFRKTIWNNFIGAVKEYELIAPGDKIIRTSRISFIFFIERNHRFGKMC